MKITNINKALELEKVLELLANEAQSESAKELCREIIPDSELAKTKKHLGMTDDAYIMISKYGSPSFAGVRSINGSVVRAGAGGVLNMKELLNIAEFLRCVRGIKDWRDRFGSVKTSIDGYFDALVKNKYLEEKIFSAIINEEEMSDNASPELSDIRRKKRAAASRIRQQLDKIIHSSYYQKFLQEPIITMRGGRFVVPVKIEYKSEISGMVHDTSSSGATLFVEPSSVVEANNEIKVLESKERHEIDRILTAFSAEVGGFSQTILDSYNCAVSLDVIFAKGALAHTMRASLPQVNDEGRINLINARHPLIDRNKVVPTDIRLGIDYSTLVITGPNTGGKTVSIKTIGLLTLMAMCGLMLPCGDGSEISVFDNVFADIGDEQSIEQSLSTFSAHITNTIGIMKNANENSLVLLDELGAGTDPAEGAALATAILEELKFKGAKIAATTHYAELKVYAFDTVGVENASYEFDIETLRPTYRLIIGAPGKSNAFAISQRLGMDEHVISRAKALVTAENRSFERISEKLEASRIAMEREREEAERLKIQAREELQMAQAKRDEIEGIYEKEINNARSEALRIAEKARRESSELLDELNKLRKDKEKSDARELYERAKRTVKSKLGTLEDTAAYQREEEDDGDYVLPRALKVGDTVFVKPMSLNATVIKLADKSGLVSVQAGMIKTRVKESELRLIEAKSSSKPQRSAYRNTDRLTAKIENTASQSLDIRGKNVEEASIEIDFFIDSALRMGLNEIMIIHGKGTGALRKGVHQYLKRHPFVKSFRLGVFGEGEDGVTVAELK